ncbi:hypothetical protein [Antarctobacter sp.]|uniref:hypothetical protein n=1 Tax=Antarctobacter sp. TaxID=1872577 RepID=UPI002B27B00B|nr:hypothetical protein [Antarctobacter sp.]
MRRNGWHTHEQDGCYVLARHWPPLFDVAAVSGFPPARASRLARQIRQDLWRKFQHLRGFSPVVEVAATEDGVIVRAGGRLSGRTPPGTEGRIRDLLDSPAHRARWMVCAGEDA